LENISVFYKSNRIIYTLVAKVKERKMANKKFWLGILVMALVFGLMVVGCDDGGNEVESPGENTGGNTGENTGGNTGGNMGGNTGGNNPVLTLTSVEASPTGNLVPYIYIGFNSNAGITINDITISGVNGVTKSGHLNDMTHGGGTSYLVGLRTKAQTRGTITVYVNKSGKPVNGSPRTVYVYNNTNSDYP
jgi:hypothetical protein